MHSGLQLHQETGWLRQNGEFGDLTADHGDLIAAVEARTIAAVFIDFVGKILAGSERKSHSAEEFRDARKEADTTNPMLS